MYSSPVPAARRPEGPRVRTGASDNAAPPAALADDAEADRRRGDRRGQPPRRGRSGRRRRSVRRPTGSRRARRCCRGPRALRPARDRVTARPSRLGVLGKRLSRIAGSSTSSPTILLPQLGDRQLAHCRPVRAPTRGGFRRPELADGLPRMDARPGRPALAEVFESLGAPDPRARGAGCSWRCSTGSCSDQLAAPDRTTRNRDPAGPRCLVRTRAGEKSKREEVESNTASRSTPVIATVLALFALALAACGDGGGSRRTRRPRTSPRSRRPTGSRAAI